MYAPYFAKQINYVDGHYSPSTYKNRNNLSFDYWFRHLLARILGHINIDYEKDITGRDKSFVNFVLFVDGYVGVAREKEVGLYAQYCTLSGYNFYYQPASFIVANPKFKKSKEYEIGKDGAILRSMPDYMGLYDVLCYYADLLSSLDVSINTAIINAKMAHVLGGKNKSATMALKAMVDKINKGEPAVFYDKRISDTETGEPFQYIELFGKDKYILDLLLADRQTILNDFDVEIGIKALPYNKKERLLQDEANAKGGDAKSKLDIIIDTISEDLAIINDLFDCNWTVSTNDEEGGEDDVIINDDNRID